jgi:SAM-dependent methyltransferase
MSSFQSRKYLEWRFSEYPLFREFMQLYSDHSDEVILDYGCGPGNDLTGFALYSRAKEIVGCDVSKNALQLAQHRLALHRIDPERIKLFRTSDLQNDLPLEDDSVDYIHCAGVLHHVSEPECIVKEFYRILKPGSKACIMVYNYNSLWVHLYTAYKKMILEDAFPGLSLEETFSRNTDGENCPIARYYTSDDFLKVCREVGFRGEYVGGYLSSHELRILEEVGETALGDERLADKHREFLQNLTYDKNGYPMYKGKHAGIGGVYRLSKQ